jgi:hypothetical protein
MEALKARTGVPFHTQLRFALRDYLQAATGRGWPPSEPHTVSPEAPTPENDPVGRVRAPTVTRGAPAPTDPAWEDDEPSTVPAGTGDTWAPPLRKPVPPHPLEPEAHPWSSLEAFDPPPDPDVVPREPGRKITAAEQAAMRTALRGVRLP